MTSQLWVAEKITPIVAKTPNTTAKKLKIDLEKMYPIKLKYTTVWKAKQRAMKNLYGDWANTFRMLYNFKAEVEKRSPGSVVEIDTEVSAKGEVKFSKFFYGFEALHRWLQSRVPSIFEHRLIIFDRQVEWSVGSMQCSRWTQLDVSYCCWLVSVRNRGFMDMVHDPVEKMPRASVTFGYTHRCM